MACVFGSQYAFHLIAKGPMVCRFSGSFFCTAYRFAITTGIEVTNPIFEISMTMRTRLPDVFTT